MFQTSRFLVFVLLIVLTGLVQAQSEEECIDIQLYRDDDSLAFYIDSADTDTVSLAGLAIEEVSDGESIFHPIADYPAFVALKLKSTPVQLPICFVIKKGGATQQLPEECLELESTQRHIQELASGSVFWFDSSTNSATGFNIVQGEETLLSVPARNDDFDFAYCSGSSTTSVNVSEMVITDFESGSPNNLGYDMGAFFDPNKDIVEESYEDGQVTIDYTLTDNSFGGFWVKLGGTDFSPYQLLSFDISATESFPLKIELKRDDNRESASLDIDVEPTMQTIDITLTDFGLSDLTNMTELVFVLEEANSGNAGTLTIDNITLSSEKPIVEPIATQSVLVLANFDDGNPGNAGVFYSGENQVEDSYESGELKVKYTLVDFGGYWMQLGGQDFSAFENLTFDIRSEVPISSLKIELKRPGEVRFVMLDAIYTSSQPISIELSKFGLTSLTDISELVFVLETQNVGTSGALYIDNIVLR